MNRSIQRTWLRLFLVPVLIAATSVVLPLYKGEPSRLGFVTRSAARPALKAMKGPGLHTLYAREDGVGCRVATREESNTLLERDPNLQLHVISPIRTHNLAPAEAGLTIVLRGTDQLNAFPEAVNAFNRAAALWMSLIQTPITVVVDVDFGPTRFGRPYPQGVLGSTDSQDVGADEIYSEVRAALIASASNVQEEAIYNSLPANTIPTDRGEVSFMIGPTSVFRALGLINPIADPIAEEEDFGDPPSIGFNSNFAYDFNPDDGITPGTIDFDAVAVHELGHVLGFVSNVGLKELSNNFPDAASVWDLFRLRPGATPDIFSNALRILSSGGEQSQFVSGLEVPQSTGRIDGSGGDGEQSSHWKDDVFINRKIGIMDPTLGTGDREQISSHDIAAIALFGYTLSPAGMIASVAPESGTIRAAIDVPGQTLTITGAATDANSDIVEARLALVDDLNRIVREFTAPLSNTDESRIVSFNLQFGDLGQFSAIRRAMLTISDSGARISQTVPADVFFDNDPNRPTITKINRKGKKLVITGKGFTNVRVEINGLIVAPPINIGGSNKKVKIKGTDSQLNLLPGTNRIRVISGNTRSDAALFNL